jgi:hypothetical protein
MSQHAPDKPHDVGGLPGGPIDRSEHDTAYWEWQVDAMVRLLMKKGVLVDFAELRHGIESLSPEDYETLTYYERWSASVARALIKKGVIDAEELEARITKLAAEAKP